MSVDLAKIARARMLTGLSRHDEAHQWIKQALEADPRDFNTRAFYTWFFYNCNRYKEGADFTSASLKQNPNDVYNLCAYGWFMHHAGREGRQRTDEAQAERMKTFTRAATSFSNALTHDPSCAVAAQGLAMIVAEDLLDSWAPGKPINDTKAKANAREALAALTKVKESLNDGSVYVNMGHCYFVRDDFERAIESASYFPWSVASGVLNGYPSSMRLHRIVSIMVQILQHFYIFADHGTPKPTRINPSLP